MPRPSAEAIRDRIRIAVTAEVAEKGIGATSVGAVAKRAGVAPGTIYLHFENKEDMLQKIYIRIKEEFHASMMAALKGGTSAETLKRMWFDMFDYVTKHPNDFLFIEFAGAAQVLTAEQSDEISYIRDEIRDVIDQAIDDGTLINLPVSVVTTMFVAPAMHMARNAIAYGSEINRGDITLTFERVWVSIAAQGT